MKYVRSLLCVSAMVAAVSAQPYMAFDSTLYPSIQGTFVWVDGNGNIQTQNLFGSGGTVSLNYPAANGRWSAVIPNYSLISGGDVTFRRAQSGPQEGIKDPFNTNLNQQIGPVMKPLTGTVVQARGGQVWTFTIKQLPNTATGNLPAADLGITDQIVFSAACFPNAAKRGEIGSGTSSSNHADSTYFTISCPNVKCFTQGSAPTEHRVILSVKPANGTTVTGNGGIQYKPRISGVYGMRTEDQYGNDLRSYGGIWPLNYITITTYVTYDQQ